MIDGLDEHLPSIPDERRQLVSKLFKLQKDFPVNILTTSSVISEILGDFEDYPCKEISAVEEDVLNYVNMRMLLLVHGTVTSYPATQGEI